MRDMVGALTRRLDARLAAGDDAFVDLTAKWLPRSSATTRRKAERLSLTNVCASDREASGLAQTMTPFTPPAITSATSPSFSVGGCDDDDDDDFRKRQGFWMLNT